MSARMSLDLGHEPRAAFLLLGRGTDELNLLLGGHAGSLEHGVVGGGLLVDDDGGFRDVEIFVGKVRAGGGLPSEEGGSLGPRRKSAGIVHADGVGEGAFARCDVEHVVW